jgi:hypothetical protein
MLITGIPSVVREKYPQVVKEYESLRMDDHAVMLDIVWFNDKLDRVSIIHYLICKACLKSEVKK